MLAERKKGEREKRRRVNFAQIDESILSRVAMYNGRCVTVAVRCTDDFIRGNENTYTCYVRRMEGPCRPFLRARDPIFQVRRVLSSIPPSRGGRRPRKRRLSIVTKRKRVVVTGRGVAGCILINRGDIVPTNCHSRVSSSAADSSWNRGTRPSRPIREHISTHLFLDRGECEFLNSRRVNSK